MEKVYGAFVQWKALVPSSERLNLSTVMNNCAKMDKIHNRYSSTSTVINSHGSNSGRNQDNSGLTTSEGGDKIDLYLVNNRSNSFQRFRSTDSRGNKFNQNRSNSNTNKPKNNRRDTKKDTDKKETKVPGGGSGQKDLSKVKCYHCDGLGHVKKKCKGYKKMMSVLGEKTEAKVMELGSSKGSGLELEN
ncbi:hypothetical protein DFH27DRAFT_617334 [Peziza echinospora]|nr:hypothetical protein DFH27DRAFT_617334 [Peziza echinospora]